MTRRKHPTDAEKDIAFGDGKRAWHKDFNVAIASFESMRSARPTPNPHPEGSVLAKYWEKGYRQDVTR